jgi:hypothetical protein
VYRRFTETVLLIVLAVVLLLVAGGTTMVRRTAQASEDEGRAGRIRSDVDRQFRKPPHEGDLL